MKKGITLLGGAVLTFALTSCGSTISSSLLSSGNGSSGGEVSSSVSGGPSTASDGTGSGDISASQDTSTNTSQGGSASSQGTSTTSVSIGGSLGDTPSLYFHYHRTDGNYDGWGLWTWPQGQDGKRTNFDSTDGFGAYEVLPLSTWSGVSSLNYIVSTANWNKDPGPNESFNFADYTVDSVGNVVVFKMTGTSGVYKTATEAFAAGGSTSSSSASSGGSSSTTSYRPGSTITSISYPSTSVSHPTEWYNKWNIDETSEARMPSRPLRRMPRPIMTSNCGTNILPPIGRSLRPIPEPAKTSGMSRSISRSPAVSIMAISPMTPSAGIKMPAPTTTIRHGAATFKGLIEKMDYIKALGFTAIWITPVVENTSGLDYHGYHASNLNKVDPRYESEDVDFQKVINEAHKRDMKIVLDVVWNHTGNFGEMGLMPDVLEERRPQLLQLRASSGQLGPSEQLRFLSGWQAI
jgi:hypothetical protein